jgi:hypothetical protein
MRKWASSAGATAAALLMVSCAGPVQHPAQQIDAPLRAEIWRIRAIDNHAHPNRLTGPNEKDDTVDALPVEAMQPFPLPIRLDPSNPEYQRAWSELFSYRGSDADSAVQAKQQAMREQGDRYPAHILNELGIDVMLANRISMGRGLGSDRFKWVPFADPLLFPLNNSALGSRDPDRAHFFSAEEKLLGQYVSQAGQTQLPKTLDDYLRLITATLQRHKQEGAVAEKFEVAYLRALDFGNPSRTDAAAVYSRYAGSSGQPTVAEYKSLQDFLFRYVAAECGRLGLPVHIHSCAGAGAYYDISGANPILLEPVLNDPTLRKTQFVIIHGGWPFTREVLALLEKPNVWTDFSMQPLLVAPRELAATLRQWLGFMPDRILFGTDASPITPAVGWEETGWVSVEGGRDALGLALTGMMRDHEITRNRASQLAHMVLRDNARRLYGWK